VRTLRSLFRSLLVVSAALGSLALSGCANSTQPSRPETRLVPREQSIQSGELTVAAGDNRRIQFEVGSDFIDPVVKGTFTASGGTGNDVQAALADGPNMTNWVNGHQAMVLWETPGQVTTGSFEVRLKPGMYYLGISNRFSVVSDKNVSLDVKLSYKQSETATPQ
jgi:hypothetical protein